MLVNDPGKADPFEGEGAIGLLMPALGAVEVLSGLLGVPPLLVTSWVGWAADPEPVPDDPPAAWAKAGISAAEERRAAKPRHWVIFFMEIGVI